MYSFITIDTDNAVIRFYETRARLAGIDAAAISTLEYSLRTVALGISNMLDIEFRVEVVR